MSTYELDDDLVRELISDLRNLLDGDTIHTAADILEAQLPRPVPTKTGAVVRTEDGSIWVLAPCGNHWLREADAFEEGRSHVGQRDFLHRHNMPRVTEVLSEGVDL